MVSVPAGYTDTNAGNNTSTDTDSPAVDLQITKDDGVATYAPGGTLTYTIVVTNPSTFTVNGVTVTDSFPAANSPAQVGRAQGPAGRPALQAVWVISMIRSICPLICPLFKRYLYGNGKHFRERGWHTYKHCICHYAGRFY